MPVLPPDGFQGASSEVARDINRRIVLNLIRIRHPISRADLARLSGLQRSTISLIVEQLVEERWVLEGPTGRPPRGRRPTFLRLNEDRVIVGVDLRPAETTVALADVNGRFTEREVLPTAPDAARCIELIIKSIRRILQLCRDKKVEGVGISLPGRIDSRTSRLVFAPNLGWPEVDLQTPIAQATGLPVELENAANACVLAAVWFDRLESCRNLVVVTVSEGIGTGVLMNGQLARGLNGLAGEFGHVQFDADGPVCGCGNRGCWEVFASNCAALRYYFESVRDAKPGALTFPDLLSLADRDDPHAAKALRTMAQYLARGLRILVVGLAPERIIVVGDLTRSWRHFGPVIDAEIRSQLLPGAIAPLVVAASEDGMARLRGTVALVLQNDFGLSREVPVRAANPAV